MDITLLPNKIIQLHKNSILNWKKHTLVLTEKNFLQLVEENHSYNFKLWNAEDCARIDDKGSLYVYHAKREIDKYNQQRNNCMEKMDTFLFDLLKPAADSNVPVHSETPGMIIDRLSILALKIYHMNLQLERKDASKDHLEVCKNKIFLLNEQHIQLTLCLSDFLKEIKNQTRTFRIYYQCKMYNDPAYNIRKLPG